MTLISGSVSKVLSRFWDRFVPIVCMRARRICIHAHTHVRTHHKPTRMYINSHTVSGVNVCVKLSSFQSNPWVNGVLCARHSSVSFWGFLGIRPHLLPGAAGQDQSWLGFLGWWVIACGTASLDSGGVTGRHRGTQHLGWDARRWHRSHTPGRVKPVLIQHRANPHCADWWPACRRWGFNSSINADMPLPGSPRLQKHKIQITQWSTY